MRKLIVLFLIIMLGGGCAGVQKPRELDSGGGSQIFAGWMDQTRLPRDAYFVTIEKKADDKWQVVRVLNRPVLGRDNEDQEVLFVDKEFKHTQPYFEYYPPTTANLGAAYDNKTIDRGTFVCQLFDGGSQAVKFSDKRYTPCSSRLTKTIVGATLFKNLASLVTTWGLATGHHQAVDPNHVIGAYREAGVEQACKDFVAKGIKEAK